MGKQSARIYLNGKDHKAICINKNYHEQVYDKDELIWESIDEAYEGFVFTTNTSNIMFKIAGDFTVDWGDGTVESYSMDTLSLIYHDGLGGRDVTITGNVTDISFEASDSIRAVKTPLPPSLSAKEDFTRMFAFNDYLYSVPYNLFKYCTSAKILNGVFYNCTNLREIPKKLFYYCKKVLSFASCFNGCTKISEIPEGLFDKCTLATEFQFCFYRTAISEIPATLFRYCNTITNMASCFRSTDITSIPEELFINMQFVTAFDSCFRQCDKLTAIPEGLFDYCVNAETFSEVFYGCSVLQSVPYELFDNCNKITNVSYAFYADDEITSSVPPLWERETITEYVGCYQECSAIIDNWVDIPYAWKYS